MAYGRVSGAIPAISSARSRGSFLARLRQDALKLRRGGRDQPLGSLEALRVGQRAHRRLQLLVGEHQEDLTSCGSSSPITETASAPPTAAAMFASSVVSESRTSTAAMM